eukprot:10266310-Ditylum_brightwellii.AAC.1
MSASAKLVWLEAVRTAKHDFTVLNKRSPLQRTITELFDAQTTNTNTSTNTNTNTTTQATNKNIAQNITAKNWDNADEWDNPDSI